MKTIINLIVAVALVVAVVTLSNGSFKDLKKNSLKVVDTTISIVDSGMEKLNDNQE